MLKVIIGIWVILGILFGVEYVAHYAILDGVRVWEGNCQMIGWEVSKATFWTTAELRLKLNCNGKETYTDQPQVLFAYIRQPSPISCKLYQTGRVRCEEPER